MTTPPTPPFPGPLPPAALLLDLDGTLVDSEDLHFASVVTVLAEHGVRFEEGDYRQYFGFAEAPFWRDMRTHYQLAVSLEELIAARNRAYLTALHATSIRPLPGVLDLLDWAEAKGIAAAVASSSPRAQIDATLAAAGLAERLPVRRSGHEDVRHGKPNPEVYLAAAAALGVPAGDCWALEDSPTGLAAARASGAFTIAVGTRCPVDEGAADLCCAGGIPDLLAQLSG